MGQLSKVQPANDDIAIVYAVVRSSVEEQAKVEGEYTIESFATQTVNGINYFIKVRDGRRVRKGEGMDWNHRKARGRGHICCCVWPMWFFSAHNPHHARFAQT